MECPHRIEPHQIQGLDFIHIFPVIQWLVKKSVNVREERRDFIRSHAILEYENKYSSNDNSVAAAVENVKKLKEKYRRKRLYKRKDDLPDNEELQVESTLLEYGFPQKPDVGDSKSITGDLYSEMQEIEDVSFFFLF